jgi:5'-3' exonuclease
MKMRFDLERIIDDFVFFCFFIGNDFMPTLSALDIAEGSLDKLIEFYQKCLPQMQGYITERGTIHWDRAEPFIWMLAEHEHEVFKNRIDEIENRRRAPRTTHVTQETALMQTRELQGKGTFTQNMFKQKVYEKKVAKVEKLKIDSKGKTYKKHLITKLFKEDEEQMPKYKKTERANRIAKLKALYQAKMEAEAQPIDEMDPLDLLNKIDPGNLSDLKPEEIPDDQVSDVETGLETLEGAAAGEGGQDQGAVDAQASLDRKVEDENLKFMTDFVKKYAVDAQEAKQYYYQTKVRIDISTEEGKQQRRKMLKKYLEGMQWVLFYYYKGSPHWRWYYPYHYAPMISDLGIKVQDFLGTTTIQNFEVDFNCPKNMDPYTPFQQLLCIMPIRSFKLLPKEYGAVPQVMDKDYP